MNLSYNIIIESGLIFIILFSPLAYGSVEVWSITIIEVTILLMAVTWIVKEIVYLHTPTIITPVTLLFLFFIIIVLFQMIPLPHSIMKVISPARYRLYIDNITNYSIPNTWQTLTIYTHATKQELIKLICFFSLFLLIINHIKSRRQIYLIMTTIVISGFMIAFFGIIQHYTWNGHIYWFRKLTYSGSPFGPYVNKNHFAGYMEMAIPLGIGLLLKQGMKNPFPQTIEWRQIIRWLEKKESNISILLLFALIIMISALFLSLSRGGIIGFLISMFFLTAILTRKRYYKRYTWGIIFSMLFLMIISLSWFGIDPLIDRFAMLKDGIFRERLPIWKDTFGIIRDYPLFGTGLATFEYIFPEYRASYSIIKFSHPENEYIQILSETGIIGTIIIILVNYTFFKETLSLLRTKMSRSDMRDYMIVLSGFTSYIAIIVHSFADFNLHIPANALLFTIIISMTYSIIISRESRRYQIREQ
ncbi:MAG: O-antigen ligase family protein [Nitrospirota bacterium]